MLRFYSVDLTIDAENKPYLIEVNGSNSGFDGFLIAYEDSSIQDAISRAFRACLGERPIYVVTRLVNLGELPRGYLDKLVQDMLYFQNIDNVHANLRQGIVGTHWARMRTDRPPSTMGAGTSLDALVARDPRFRKSFLNVADPAYVIPAGPFDDKTEAGVISLKAGVTDQVQAIPLHDDDVLWLRCPTLAYAEPVCRGMVVNPEFPWDAVPDNKWFTYEALAKFASNSPLSVPIGNRCSGSATVGRFLRQSPSELFIRKPLLGSQGRGIEVLRRQDVEEYWRRLERLEEQDAQSRDGLPLELRGVPQLLAAWALSFDVNLLSELVPSRPLYCRQTGRLHHGCMRTVALVEGEAERGLCVHFLGAYWRLARVPVDGDGVLWERFVGSQSQGAFCEPVSAENLALVRPFVADVLQEYCRKLAVMPQDRPGYVAWEKDYWTRRYRQEIPVLADGRTWGLFRTELAAAERMNAEIKARAEQAGFRFKPSALLTREQVLSARLPYLLREPERIALPTS